MSGNTILVSSRERARARVMEAGSGGCEGGGGLAIIGRKEKLPGQDEVDMQAAGDTTVKPYRAGLTPFGDILDILTLATFLLKFI